MPDIRQRSEIPIQDTWDTASVYASDAAWEADFQWLEKQIPALAKQRGKLKTANALAQWLGAVEEIGKRIGRVSLYASMFFTTDTGDARAAAMNDRARGLQARVDAAMSFAQPEILKIGLPKLKQWMKRNARLKIYAHYFDRLYRRQAHVRSGEVEEILSAVSDPFRTAVAAHGVLTDAEMRFPYARMLDEEQHPLEVTQGTINALLTHPDREIRRTAWEGYADAHLANKNAIAAILSAGVKQDVFMARARKYKSSLDAALSANNIPEPVYRNFIETFRKNLPTWHRYWDVRRRALGVEKLYIYDERAPLTSAKPCVSFEQAVDWIGAGMAPLGADYANMLRRGVLQERWVDKYPNVGKRQGAFSTGLMGTRPFILMSFNDDLFSMSTLAHELGHSMHKQFTNAAQPFVYSRYGIFLAEVASNFNQALVRGYLLKNASVIASRETAKQSPSGMEIASQKPLATTAEDFQIAIIEEAMANFHRYFLIMPTLARFELEIHERVERGKPLTAKSMIELCADLFAEAYGDGVVVDRERIGITWARFATHLYSNFYVYQYGTGISAAHALAQGVLDGKPRAVENYRAFLNAGGSMYPLDTLKMAGVDLTTPAPVEKTFQVLAQYVDRLEQLTAKQ
ncbi:MAG: oligoendopeptidase F family protein [Chloroflexi bacterium]|nr:oligoendopeptidase F family protein [Chloroflexota bacterium]